MARFVAEVEEAIIVLCKELPVKSLVTIFRGKKNSQEMRDDFFLGTNIFTSKIGEDEPNLTNMFQMGLKPPACQKMSEASSQDKSLAC